MTRSFRQLFPSNLHLYSFTITTHKHILWTEGDTSSLMWAREGKYCFSRLALHISLGTSLTNKNPLLTHHTLDFYSNRTCVYLPQFDPFPMAQV